MIQSVFVIGGVLTVISIIAGFVVVKSAPKSAYTGYIPSAVLFGGGLILLLLATMMNVKFLGAGYGGWGIASLFAAGIGFVTTSTVDALGQEAKV